MELENIVANTVYLKAREGKVTYLGDLNINIFLIQVVPIVIKARAKSGGRFYNFPTYHNVLNSSTK